MSILTVTNLAKSFGADQLFSDITFSIAAGQKFGLVGRNGGGKTTLLRILMGQELPDTTGTTPARISLAAGRRLGYLKQEAPVHPERTLAEEVEVALGPYRAAQAAIEAAGVAMADAGDDADKLQDALDAYTAAQDDFDSRGGWELEGTIESTLRSLGFKPSDMDKAVGDCSGGEQTRLALAKLVLTRPDLLILDEPTNHLDIEAVEWLETFLKEYAGAVILVSHDRTFLDAIVDTIADLDNGKLTLYRGNYTQFRQQKQERLDRQHEQWKQQQKEIERLKDLIKRNQGGGDTESKIRKVTQGRIERMDKVERVFVDTSRMRAKVDEKGAGRIGRDVLTLDNLGKRFDDKVLFENLDLNVERGDRVGFVGPNGAGKSTLVKLLLGEEEPTTGRVQWGHNVRRAYFSQHAAESLDLKISVLETLGLAMPDWNETQCRGWLARFLFMGDDVFKKVEMLSGGEKNKLVLACMLLNPVNLLILDEPTNHLDVESCEALGEMLTEYSGTLFLVSHDRYLLNQVTNKTLGLTGRGTANWVVGNYSVWRASQGGGDEAIPSNAIPAKQQSRGAKPKAKK